MENEKKNNGTLVGILIGLVIALIIGGCLLATGMISFKTNTTTDNGQSAAGNIDNNEISSDSNNQINGTYMGYFRDDKIAYSTTLVLSSNNEFKICLRYECLDGKYTINNNNLL